MFEIRIIVVALSMFLAGCGGGGGEPESTASESNNSITAIVTGLDGVGLKLSINDGTPLALIANGESQLNHTLSEGNSYSIKVTEQPSTPNQTCSTVGSSGVLRGNSTVTISCSTDSIEAQKSAFLSIAPSVSTVTKTRVKNILTGVGIGAPNTWIQLALSEGNESIALAVDTSGDILLAAMIDSPRVVMSAESTALALVRLLIAGAPVGSDGKTQNELIRSGASFGPLVSLIEGQLNAGARLLGDPAIALAIVESATNINRLPATNRARVRALALAPDRLTGYAPFPIIAGNRPENPLVSAAVANKSLGLTNNMPIPWKAVTELPSGEVFGGPVTLNSASIIGGGSLRFLPMRNAPFNVRLYHDKESLNDIAMIFGEYAFQAVAEFIQTDLKVKSSCTSEIIFGIIKTQSKPIITSGGFDGFLDALPESLTADTIAAVVEECTQSLNIDIGLTAAVTYAAVQKYYIDVIREAIGLAKKVGKVPMLLFDAARVIQLAALAEKYWNIEPMIGVCATIDFEVASCVERLSLNPPSLLMAPGSNAVIAITGFSAANKETALPGDLLFESEDESRLSVAGHSYLTATTAGRGSFVSLPLHVTATVTEPTLGASEKLQVTVDQPILSADRTDFISTVTDQVFSVTLTGPKGEPICGVVASTNCIIVPERLNWTTKANPAMLIRSDSSDDTTSFWKIPAGAMAGVAEIIATDPAGNEYKPLRISIEEPIFIYQLKKPGESVEGGESGTGFSTPVEISSSTTITRTSSTSAPVTTTTTSENIGVIPVFGNGYPLTIYIATICKLGDSWIPKTYSYSASNSTPVIGSSCTGAGSRYNWTGSLSLEADGELLVTHSKLQEASSTCNYNDITVDYSNSETSNDSIYRINLFTGRGEYTNTFRQRIEFDRVSTIQGLSGWSKNSQDGYGSGSWPHEEVTPPTLPGVTLTLIGISPSSMPVPLVCTQP